MMVVLTLIVMYGIIGELTSPGAILPGVVGVIALVLLLYMAAVLPMNVAGLALIGVAIGLFIIDVFSPTYGILTGGGIVAIFVGEVKIFWSYDTFLGLLVGCVVRQRGGTGGCFMFHIREGLWGQRLMVQSRRGG